MDKRWFVVIVAMVLTCGMSVSAGVLTFEDVFSFEQAGDPQFSPDGERIVYVRRSMDIMRDRSKSRLWIVGKDGSDHRPMTSTDGNHSSPGFSPDGSKLAYISDRTGSSQIHVRWLNSDQTARITNVGSSPSAPVWSPDGRMLAFTMFVPDRPEPMIHMPPKPEGAEWAEPSRVIDSLVYRADGRGYVEQGNTHLFLIPVEGGTPRQLTSGPYNHDGIPRWLPDGQSLLIDGNRHEDWKFDRRNSEIYEVQVEDGSIRALTDRKGPDNSPVISPDGTRIAFVGNDESGISYLQDVLYVMNRDGGKVRALTAGLDRSVGNPQWAADGKSILLQYTDSGMGHVARVDLKGRVTTLVEDAGGMSLGRPYAAATYRSNGTGSIVYTRSRSDRPADLYFRGADGKSQRLTALNEDLLAHRQLGRVERIQFPSSFDGRPVEAWVVTPPDFDPQKKYPLILEIHGGPYAAYGPHFSAEIQLMAAEGYVVVYVNPRGSTSYGAEFANLIHQNYPSEDFNDLMDAVDVTIARGFIDTKNLFVTGGSGGGVLTAWIVGTTDRFAAAVSAKPVINWISGALTTDIAVVFTRYWMPGMPWDFMEKYWQLSPLSRVGNVTTPTMVLTGESDYRTPISESEQFYQALKLQQVDAAMVRIPGASHGIAARPSNLIRKVKYILAWFERYRTEKPSASD